MHCAQYKSARFDLLDNNQPSNRHSNFMDLTHTSGYALAVLFLLRAKPGDFASHFGIKCASFSKMNIGTSRRSACGPVGHSEHRSVQIANNLLERTCALVLLVTALGGAWSVEQPSGSLLEFYPVWREVIQHIFSCGPMREVVDGSLQFEDGETTAKRHYCYSNTASILKIDKGKLQGWKSKHPGIKTADRYRDGSGKLRYKGTVHLRGTENYPVPFARAVVDLVEEMKATAEGQPQLPPRELLPPAIETFTTAGWEESDTWQFADFIPVYNYLRRCKHLVVPREWQTLLPIKLHETTVV
ncbi:unnamed protein product [Durusdinium trenchii]|uniref:Uncharacterized protein n=1 Tax=Durusdinium trenchii TaxID=1381693 RepID=A0ABP0H6S1_9DINO